MDTVKNTCTNFGKSTLAFIGGAVGGAAIGFGAAVATAVEYGKSKGVEVATNAFPAVADKMAPAVETLCLIYESGSDKVLCNSTTLLSGMATIISQAKDNITAEGLGAAFEATGEALEWSGIALAGAVVLGTAINSYYRSDNGDGYMTL